MQEGQRHYSTPTERWFHRSSPELNHRCDLLTHTSVLENEQITTRDPFWGYFWHYKYFISWTKSLHLFYLLNRTNYPPPLPKPPTITQATPTTSVTKPKPTSTYGLALRFTHHYCQHDLVCNLALCLFRN